jgi:beta-N-acetylhexosaminidase
VDRAVGVRAHTELAEHIAERSITLVRDREGRIPLPRDARRVLSITYASPADAIAGRAFNGVLGDGDLELDEVRVDARTPPSELEKLSRRARQADLVLVSAYVSPLENAGTIGAAQTFSGFVDELATDGVPVVVVSFGSPYLLSEFPSVSAYLIAWGGAEVSQRAAATALRGETPITGTLPISLPPQHAVGDGILP